MLLIEEQGPVVRVTRSTRAAVLTGSPMTVNSSRPPPPIVPATTGPELMPTPTRTSPAYSARTR